LVKGKGYKPTDIGVVPEDWVVGELGALGKFKNGINKNSEDFGFGFPFVNLMDVFGVSSISENQHLGLVNSNNIEKKVYDLKRGDVVFVRSSVKPTGVGLTTVVKKDLPDTVYSGFLIRFRETGCLNTNFKEYCFSEETLDKGLLLVALLVLTPILIKTT
jgi:type I restriction enzyme S subunit